jgi:Protein of unknown function (DUF3987)
MPEPHVQNAPISRPWPKLGDAALIGLVGAYISLVAPATEADPVALLVQFLCFFGNCAGRSLYAVAEGAKHCLNIYLVLAGDSSKARKGTSAAHVRRFFQFVDSAWADGRIVSGLSSGEGAIFAVRDPVTKQRMGKTITIDPGVDDKRLNVLEPEFAAALSAAGRNGSILSMVLRDAWDNGFLNTLVKNSPNRATGAHISIAAHVTIEELLRFLDRTELLSGFCNRFLFCAVRRSNVLPFGGNVDEHQLQQLAEKVKEAIVFARKGGQLTFDDDARKLWEAIYPELSAPKPGLLGAVVARGEAQTLRLSCLYAALDLSAVVTAKHLSAALAVWQYCEASASYIFSDQLGDPDADAILTALRASPTGLTKTEISALFGRNRNATQIDRALGVLVTASRARPLDIIGPGGRRVSRWVAIEKTR